MYNYFPFPFTGEQHKAIDEIKQDLSSGRVMSRLLHGDVGVGKSAVAFFVAMGCAKQGKRTLILCPTTILAQQHWNTLWSMGWSDMTLVTGARKVSLNDQQFNLGQIIIGTHTLLHDEVLLASSSLVIIDEFQKFGVEQRQQITKHNPHLLLMSATPVPRSLAMTVFGDLDISTIKEPPIKRGTVITKWVLPEKRDAMYEIIERELAKGHQVYFVFPRISGDEDVVSAERGFAELCARFKMGFGIDNSIELLTGRDSTKAKARTLKLFREGYIKILVSTTIAEVGLDNSNATVMCIMGADRFGLSTLHQCRGRICRSTSTTFCFLVSETSNPTSIARLEVIERCNDGFIIAEEDLRLRGAGEVFSTRQTGLPDLKWCSLVDDFDLMLEARDLVNAGSVGSGVREMMLLKYGSNLKLGEVT